MRGRDAAVVRETIFSSGSTTSRHLVALAAEQARSLSRVWELDDPQGMAAEWQQHDPPARSTDQGFKGGGAVGWSRSGHEMMRWFGQTFGDEARRPPSGPTRSDTMLSPIFPGRKPGF
jgi:hypothetical protein